MKQCFKCKVVKPLVEFHAHKQMADGHLNKCKVCARKDITARIKEKKKDPEWMAKERERCRVKQERLRKEGRAGKTSSAAIARWKKRNPIKTRAQQQAFKAHKNKPDRCSQCKKKVKLLHRHHPDYSKPKVIVWLCPPCHGKAHRKS